MTHFLDTPAGRVAFDREGDGPPVVLIAGAFQFRAFDPGTAELATELAGRGLTVIHYDRLGRGETESTPPYTLDDEIAVLRAFAGELGPLALYGSSSGSAIALAAAAAGVPVTKLVLWEAPVGSDDDHGAAEELAVLRDRLAAGDPEQAVLHFMRDFPAEWIEAARQGPAWAGMTSVADSLAVDDEAVAWTQSAPRRELFAGITAPVLVLVGEQTLPNFPPAAASLAAALPDARRGTVAAADHRWQLAAMADAVSGFLL